METFASFLPIILLTVIFVAFGWPMLRRKGLANTYVVLLLIPVVNYFSLIWIASKPDKAILDELAALRAKLGG
ncbi:hypothetical protein EV216_10142 [Rhodovulum steppense]|uniref:Uncharacterized protein n=1 Tax=Rhodovulum steppense TaxID=540251 RepID=A0A4R1Z2X6_9RHOB|nr:hypothetical protein EV216_10142 [Rhodovulum steppense]